MRNGVSQHYVPYLPCYMWNTRCIPSKTKKAQRKIQKLNHPVYSACVLRPVIRRAAHTQITLQLTIHKVMYVYIYYTIYNYTPDKYIHTFCMDTQGFLYEKSVFFIIKKIDLVLSSISISLFYCISDIMVGIQIENAVIKMSPFYFFNPRG